MRIFQRSLSRPWTAAMLAGLVVLAGGCADAQTDDESVESTAISEAHVEVASALVVAETPAIMAAETLADRIRLPSSVGAQYATGSPEGKNPDGFLRRVDSIRTEGDVVVIMTRPATLPEAIVDGDVRASSTGASSIDANALRSGTDFTIDLDFGKESLFENVEEVQTPTGKTRFTESIKFDRARMFARPSVDIDLSIRGNKVNRFMAKVEGKVDTSIKARVAVTADGPLSNAVTSALRERHHSINRVLYRSKSMPLRTFSVGRVPVSPSVSFTVTMRCDLSFGGPLVARAGAEARSYVRLASVFQDGGWAPPVKSDYEIQPSFEVERGSPVDAHCALEMAAELGIFGTTGVTMIVSPYVDFNVNRATAPMSDDVELRLTRQLEWTTQAGATGSIRGRADVFGLADVDRPLADWTAPLLRGFVPLAPREKIEETTP
jgi:hypothetical protein